ncbi:hypothetical protein ACFVVM_32560 [Nocardia sp. NPDC058176]|uniref:hypothetical protein n=1 Tax=Nocardia sp. NPDC058176 TaxID=3346368 RepID=UPI0036D807C1
MTETTIIDTPVSREFTVPGVGQVRAEISPASPAGVVVYSLRGHRIKGSVSMSIGYALYSDAPTTAFIGYGIDPGDDTYPRYWADRLTVNGIELVSSSNPVVLSDTARDADGFTVEVRRSGCYGHTETVPSATRIRTTAVLEFVVRDFAARDDLAEMWRRAARRAAQELLPGRRDIVDDYTRTIAAAEKDRDDARAYVAALELIASDAELPDSPTNVLRHLS